MPQVSDIIFCLKATNTEEQGVSASTILTAITPEYIPGLFTFSVIVTLLDITADQSHNLKVDFIAPTGESVVHIDSKLPIIEDTSNLPKEYKGINVTMDWTNVNFKVSGLYIIKVYIDSSKLGEKKIYVKGKNE